MLPPALADLRIGCVSFLNARPLIHGLGPSDITLEIPSRLAESFALGRVDIALLPVFALFGMGGGMAADDVAIACDGEVFSVLVASQCDFAECKTIHLDPSSRSSSALLRILLAEYYPDGPKIIDSEIIPENEPHLIIGDPAMKFRATHAAPWRFYDLGKMWQDHTGLPFVFAVWGLAPSVSNPTAVADALREIKRRGLEARPEIAAREKDPATALDYLMKFVRYDIGPREKEALKLFAHLAHKHGLVSAEPPLTYC